MPEINTPNTFGYMPESTLSVESKLLEIKHTQT